MHRSLYIAPSRLCGRRCHDSLVADTSQIVRALSISFPQATVRMIVTRTRHCYALAQQPLIVAWSAYDSETKARHLIYTAVAVVNFRGVACGTARQIAVQLHGSHPPGRDAGGLPNGR